MHKQMKTNSNQITQSRGFTLIEILVAMLILAIGVLGIAALQFKGLQYNQDAYFRTQINFLVYDIADRMRLTTGEPDDYLLANYVIPANQPGGCDETLATAANDLLCWYQLIWTALPPGSTADITNDGGGLYTIDLNWTDREGINHSIEYTFQP